MRTYIDTYMNAQKELVLDNYKKDSKAAYETLFRIYFCSDLNSAQIDIYEIDMYIHVKIIIYHRYIYSTEIKLKERKKYEMHKFGICFLFQN